MQEYDKRIVCLANSRKNMGRCVAGVELVKGKPGVWIRPVSVLPTGELTQASTVCSDGQEAALLDVLDVRFRSPRPHDYQTENHVISPSQRWTKAGTASWRDVAKIASRAPKTLWSNGDSTYNGINDQVSHDEAKKFDYSLALVLADGASFVVQDEGLQDQKMKVRCRFAHNGVTYKLMLTDIRLENDLKARGYGTYSIKDPAYLCVSLGEPFSKTGKCYKLVAGVILAPGTSL
jgi:hypothetical protein